MPAPYRYINDEEDSARWTGFPFRDGDIVISTRSKTGTTWAQMICALLIFQSPDLPAPLADLSPWLDHRIEPREDTWARLAAQSHRRLIKTHTPLDGIPLDSRATYLVTARHPLDTAVSLYHQGDNLDRDKIRALTGAAGPAPPRRPRRPLHDWLLAYVTGEEPPWLVRSHPREALDSLPGLMWHLSDAWARRAQPGVILVHYDELSADLAGQMRRIAGLLGITVAEDTWPELVATASFEGMQRRADELVPTAGVFKSNAAFFRRGTSGAGREVLTGPELDRYRDRVAALAPPGLVAWLHDPAGHPLS